MCLLGFSSTVRESGLFVLICPSCPVCDRDRAVIEGAVGNAQEDVVHVKNKQLWCSRILYCRGAPNAVVDLGKGDSARWFAVHAFSCHAVLLNRCALQFTCISH